MAADATLIVLAAGFSSRMGAPKGLLDYRGRPWLAEQLARWGGSAIVVVAPGGSLASYLAVVAAAGVRAVVNPTPELGQFASLQHGLEAAGDGRVLVLPVDVPLASLATRRALDAALDADATADAALPTHAGRGGHPVLLAPGFVARLRVMPPDGRLDAALHDARTARVAVDDPDVARNVNTPADWAQLVAVHPL